MWQSSPVRDELRVSPVREEVKRKCALGHLNCVGVRSLCRELESVVLHQFIQRSASPERFKAVGPVSVRPLRAQGRAAEQVLISVDMDREQRVTTLRRSDCAHSHESFATPANEPSLMSRMCEVRPMRKAQDSSFRKYAPVVVSCECENCCNGVAIFSHCCGDKCVW